MINRKLISPNIYLLLQLAPHYEFETVEKAIFLFSHLSNHFADQINKKESADKTGQGLKQSPTAYKEHNVADNLSESVSDRFH